jgi:hypothetical protein
MPSHVKIFAALGFLAVAYSVLSTAWFLAFPSAHYLAMLARLPAGLAVEERHMDLLSQGGITAFFAIVNAMLIWLAAFRRSNLARWSYAILFVSRQSLPLFLLLRGPEYTALVLRDYLDDLSNVRFYIAVVPVIAAIVFSFTGNARAWFARSRAPAMA